MRQSFRHIAPTFALIRGRRRRGLELEATIIFVEFLVAILLDIDREMHEYSLAARTRASVHVLEEETHTHTHTQESHRLCVVAGEETVLKMATWIASFIHCEYLSRSKSSSEKCMIHVCVRDRAIGSCSTSCGRARRMLLFKFL